MASQKRKILVTTTATWGGKSETWFKGQIIECGGGATQTALIAAIGAGNIADPSTTGYGAGFREQLGLAFAVSNSS